tara:strand:+ start:122 stop:445 length:324 start_codon:yes stop_codon:yes gene_type:complete
MQVNNTLYSAAATQVHKSGNNFPPTHVQNSQPTLEASSIRDLAKSIDPRNMNRNEARAIVAALGQTGELKLDNAIALQSMILVSENENLRTATEADFIMNEKLKRKR